MIKKIWPLILLLSIALTIFFVTGLITSIIITNGGEKNQSEIPKPTENIQNEPASADKNILVLGDSIGFGVGDEPDMGIGKRYAVLIDPEKTIAVSNLSVSGAISSELAALVEDPENAPFISAADLIIISIGANDLNSLQYEDALSLDAAFQETFNTYQENLEATLNRIRNLNPEAQIALIGLYNPYPEQDPQKSQKLFEWNYKTQLIADADLKTAYIPIDDQVKYHLDTYLAADQFHPSSIGYQVIAEELDRVLNGID
ncbi:GDSL-type esterase/lipase family protein [Acetobacterium sp.]|uniref:GDSL-type esterase/lipase family protein n=1 Tax=Acetobacterium sp. TaxID=1872094 RepID=UPI002F3E4568